MKVLKFVLFFGIGLILQSQRTFADYKIIWSGETSGEFVFSPDQYSYSYYFSKFNNTPFLRQWAEIPLSDGSTVTKETKRSVFSADCSELEVKVFSEGMRSGALMHKYLIDDIHKLIEKGELIEGQDYIENGEGKLIFRGDIEFIVDDPKGHFRRTRVNHVSLKTYWDTGTELVSTKKKSKSSTDSVDGAVMDEFFVTASPKVLIRFGMTQTIWLARAEVYNKSLEERVMTSLARIQTATRELMKKHNVKETYRPRRYFGTIRTGDLSEQNP